MKNLKKVMCGIMAGLMLTVSAPAGIPQIACVTEVQAASLETPRLVSVKAVGKKKINLQWKPVKNCAGYRIYRKTNDGKWVLQKEVTGGKSSAYSDTKVTTGQKYTYTVRAYNKNKTVISAYDKKGLTAVAGIDTLKLNRTTATLTEGNACKLKITGTSLTPVWKSNNTKIATVSKKGWVTAQAPGTVIVKGYLGGKRFDCKVTVKKYTLTASRMSQNYAKLKKFIQAKGTTDSDKNKAFVAGEQSGNEIIIVGFKYFKTQDLINLGVGYKDASEDIQLGLDIFVNCTKSNTAQAQYTAIYKEDSLDTQASFKASSYTRDTRLTFRYENGKKAGKDIQEDGNDLMKEWMPSINMALKQYTGLTLRDLGFTSYR